MLLRMFALYTPQCYCAGLHCTRHNAIAHVCIVRACAMRVLVACVCALRAGALCLCRGSPMYTLLSLVPLAAVVTIASLDDIVRVGASTWLIANYIMCGIGDGA